MSNRTETAVFSNSRGFQGGEDTSSFTKQTARIATDRVLGATCNTGNPVLSCLPVYHSACFDIGEAGKLQISYRSGRQYGTGSYACAGWYQLLQELLLYGVIELLERFFFLLDSSRSHDTVTPKLSTAVGPPTPSRSSIPMAGKTFSADAPAGSVAEAPTIHDLDLSPVWVGGPSLVRIFTLKRASIVELSWTQQLF